MKKIKHIGLDDGGFIQSRTFTALRDALLPKLMSGEIRVKKTEKSIEDINNNNNNICSH
jgi:hypothetical protein